MNEIQLFAYKGQQVRTVEKDGEVWFVAKDVCDILELTNPTMALENLDEDERAKFNLGRSPVHGGGGEVNVISEPGVYALVLRSRKPEAKAFSRWVRHKVIPSIMRHGMYMTDATAEKILADPDVFIKVLEELKAERLKNLKLTAQAESNAPKVLFAEAVETSGDSILIGAFAKMLKQNGIDINQNELFVWYRENGWLIKQQGRLWNMPTQKALDEGFFESEERVITKPDGGTVIKYTPKLTGKGQLYFMCIFMETNKTLTVGQV